jgi:hypothetical protein
LLKNAPSQAMKARYGAACATFVFTYTFVFGATWLTIPWVYPTETFPLEVRAKGMAWVRTSAPLLHFPSSDWKSSSRASWAGALEMAGSRCSTRSCSARSLKTRCIYLALSTFCPSRYGFFVHALFKPQQNTHSIYNVRSSCGRSTPKQRTAHWKRWIYSSPQGALSSGTWSVTLRASRRNTWSSRTSQMHSRLPTRSAKQIGACLRQKMRVRRRPRSTCFVK